MKLVENNYLMRQLFSPSFIRIGQKLWIFYKWLILNVSCFFSLDFRLHTTKKKKILDADADVNSLIVERSSRAKITAERIQFSFLNYLLAGR